MIKSTAAIALCGLLFLSSCDKPQSAAGVGAAENWAAHGGDSNETDYSRLDQIDKANIGRLGLAWSLDLPGEVSLEATPLAVDGVLYFTGSYAAVYAVDAATGKVLWKYDPETWKHSPAKMRLNFSVNRGSAYADGRIFAVGLDGRLFALDAKTGQQLWVTDTLLDPRQYVTGAPRAFKGKVIIGSGGADFGVRGYVTAYDQATGKQVWRFFTAPGSPEENKGDPAMEEAAKTWNGEYWKTGTGGAVWDGITFDAELNRIYLGTGNAAPYDPERRSPGGGDNLYTCSIVALDADTGKYVWHYQTTPRDSWDYDAAEQMTLADLTIDGTSHKVLMQLPKNGFFYVIDRTSGKLLSAGKAGKVTWADHIDLATGRPVEAPNIRYQEGDVTVWPGPGGAHIWQSMSYSPRTGLVYVPFSQAGSRFSKEAPGKGEMAFGGVTMGMVKDDPMDGRSALLAYDPVHQKEAWRVLHPRFVNGGTLATAGDLVFEGTGDGYFVAYNAVDGSQLWQFYAGLGIIGAPISYEAGGKQYVSILVGWGGSAGIGGALTSAGWKFAMPRRLLTFALDGNAALSTQQPDFTVHALDNPALKIDPAQAAAGAELYQNCMLCHGRYVQSGGGPGPDLRESEIALDPDNLWSVVHDGTLIQNGMPRFDDLTREQVMQLYAYIRQSARDALQPAVNPP